MKLFLITIVSILSLATHATHMMACTLKARVDYVNYPPRPAMLKGGEEFHAILNFTVTKIVTNGKTGCLPIGSKHKWIAYEEVFNNINERDIIELSYTNKGNANGSIENWFLISPKPTNPKRYGVDYVYRDIAPFLKSLNGVKNVEIKSEASSRPYFDDLYILISTESEHSQRALSVLLGIDAKFGNVSIRVENSTEE